MLNKTSTYFFLGLFLILACTPTGSYKVKSFFFDGVPVPKKPLTGEGTTTLNVTANDSTVLFKETDIIHPPYKDKVCLECHSKAYMGMPKMSQPQLCYQCHDDFGQSNDFLHGPVASGYCTQCHHPHRAKIEKLLLRNGQDLCLNCHIKDKVLQNRVHTNIQNKSCTVCHNPHGGTNTTYLNENSCFQCHDDFTANTAYVHGPVASRQCTMCHEGHKSKTPKLLVSTDNTLCLNCHNKTEVYTSLYHIHGQEDSCMSCHKPHGGDSQYFLTLKIP